VTDGVAFNFEALRYIELQEVGSKFPARSWGGYSQDYADADRVYTHEDVQIHPAEQIRYQGEALLGVDRDTAAATGTVIRSPGSAVVRCCTWSVPVVSRPAASFDCMGCPQDSPARLLQQAGTSPKRSAPRSRSASTLW